MDWKKSGKNDTSLLTARKLTVIESDPLIDVNGLPQEDREFIRASERYVRNTAVQRELNAKRGLKVFTGLAFLAGTFAIGTGGFAYNRFLRANELSIDIQKKQAELNNSESELSEVQQQRRIVENQVKSLEKQLGEVKFSSEKLNKENIRVKGELAQEQERLQVASNNLSDTQAKLISTEDSLADAAIDLEKTEFEKRKAEIGTSLELEGISALEQFEYDEIGALLSVMGTGMRLKAEVNNGMSTSDYPAMSPILVLGNILQNIKEKNYFEGFHDYVSQIEFSNDGQYLLTRSEQRVIILDYRGRQKATIDPGYPIKEAHFIPNTQLLVTIPVTYTSSPGSSIKIWTLTGDLYSEIFDDDAQKSIKADHVVLSPDGKYVLTQQIGTEELGYFDVIKIWDISGKQIGRFATLISLK